MTYDVEITDRAIFDLKTLYEYIANALMVPIAAKKQYIRIEDAIYSLRDMPERFKRYEKGPWRNRNLRIMRVDNYLVFYVVNNENFKVTVIRIVYGRRDVDKELSEA